MVDGRKAIVFTLFLILSLCATVSQPLASPLTILKPFSVKLFTTFCSLSAISLVGVKTPITAMSFIVSPSA